MILKLIKIDNKTLINCKGCPVKSLNWKMSLTTQTLSLSGGRLTINEITDEKTRQNLKLKFVDTRIRRISTGKTYPVYIQFPTHTFLKLKKERRNVYISYCL